MTPYDVWFYKQENMMVCIIYAPSNWLTGNHIVTETKYSLPPSPSLSALSWSLHFINEHWTPNAPSPHYCPSPGYIRSINNTRHYPDAGLAGPRKQEDQDSVAQWMAAMTNCEHHWTWGPWVCQNGRHAAIQPRGLADCVRSSRDPGLIVCLVSWRS